MKLEKELYTVGEVAQLFSVTKPTVYDWMKRRGLAWLRIGGRRRITRQAIERFIAAGAHGIDNGGTLAEDTRKPTMEAPVAFAP